MTTEESKALKKNRGAGEMTKRVVRLEGLETEEVLSARAVGFGHEAVDWRKSLLEILKAEKTR